jgi:fructose-1,6-bisphosphatase II
MADVGQAVRRPSSTGGADSSQASGRSEFVALLEPVALAATRAAALACQQWVGRGDGKAADAAATEAMRAVLTFAPGLGTVVIGEGEKDKAPMLYDGERLGTGHGPSFDIAVDPLECTTLCAKGLPGSLTTIAFAESGSMAVLTPAFYMDKLVGPPAVRDAVDLDDPPERTLERVAGTLGKPIEELVVVVLDKPRHGELIERLHRAGARVVSPPDGDVAGSLAALIPDGGADLLMGIGGTPEGLMTACAVRAFGGCMQARLAPQQEDEMQAVAAAGFDLDRIYELDELISGDCFFVATGVTGGTLLRHPWRSGSTWCTEAIVVQSGAVRRIAEVATEQPGVL